MDEKLEKIFADARRTLSAGGAVALDPDYLHTIERLEDGPEAAPGTDKTWVVETARRARRLLSSVRLLT